MQNKGFGEANQTRSESLYRWNRTAIKTSWKGSIFRVIFLSIWRI